MAFENSELSMDVQSIPNSISSEFVQSVEAELKKKTNMKTLILTQKSNQSNFRRKLWLFYVYYDVCNEKKKHRLI